MGQDTRFPWIQSTDSEPVDFHSLYVLPSKNQVAAPLWFVDGSEGDCKVSNTILEIVMGDLHDIYDQRKNLENLDGREARHSPEIMLDDCHFGAFCKLASGVAETVMHPIYAISHLLDNSPDFFSILRVGQRSIIA